MQWVLKKLILLFILHDAQSLSIFFFNSKANSALTSLKAQCDMPQITWESATEPCVADIKIQLPHEDKT